MWTLNQDQFFTGRTIFFAAFLVMFVICETARALMTAIDSQQRLLCDHNPAFIRMQIHVGKVREHTAKITTCSTKLQTVTSRTKQLKLQFAIC